MNIYILAFILATLDTFFCYKWLSINKHFSKTFILLIFLISFYVILMILNFISTLLYS